MNKDISKIKISFYIISALLCTLSFAIFVVFNKVLHDTVTSGLAGFSFIILLVIEGLTLDDMEDSEDLMVNFIAANILVILPIIGALFLIFCFILKIIFFHTI